MRALDDSAAALGAVMPDIPWKGIGAFTPAKLTAYRGGALMRLRRYGQGADGLLEALGQSHDEAPVTAHIDLSDAYALDGRPDQAASHADLALDIIERTRHAESLRRVAAVRRAGIPAARDLGGRIAEARDLVASGR